MANPNPDTVALIEFIARWWDYLVIGFLSLTGIGVAAKHGKSVKSSKFEHMTQVRNEMKICALELEQKQDAKFYNALEKTKAEIIEHIELLIDAK